MTSCKARCRHAAAPNKEAEQGESNAGSDADRLGADAVRGHGVLCDEVLPRRGVGGPALVTGLPRGDGPMSPTPESLNSVFFEFNDVDTPPDTTARPVPSEILRR